MIYNFSSMKKILVLTFLSAFLFSCKPHDGEIVENSQHADSLLKVINSPELAAVNKKILEAPDDANLYNERARIYMQFKQFEDAINDSKRSLRMDSTNAAFYLREPTFFSRQRNQKCKRCIGKSGEKIPEKTEGLFEIGELLLFLKTK